MRGELEMSGEGLVVPSEVNCELYFCALKD